MRYVAHFSVILLNGGATSIKPITPTAFYEWLGDCPAVCTEVTDDKGRLIIVNAILPAHEPQDDCAREHDFINSRLSDFMRDYSTVFRREYIQ